MEVYYILYFRQFVFLGNFFITVLQHYLEHIVALNCLIIGFAWMQQYCK